LYERLITTYEKNMADHFPKAQSSGRSLVIQAVDKNNEKKEKKRDTE